MIDIRLLSLSLVEYLGRFCAWLVARFTPCKAAEREVLAFLTNAPDWYSAQRLWSEKYSGATEDGISSSFTMQNALEAWRYLVIESRIEYVMKRLWRRGFLQRLQSTPKHYRIS